MNFRIFLLALIGHLIGDFILQSKYVISKRFNKKVKDMVIGNLLHSIMHFGVVSILLLVYLLSNSAFDLSTYFQIIFLILVLHSIIDIIKSILVSKYPFWKNNVFIFLLDQLIHILVLAFLSFQFNLSSILAQGRIIINNYPNNIPIVDRYLILVIVFLSSTFGIGIFIKIFINYINLKDYKNFINKGNKLVKTPNLDIGVNNGGYIIGILERIFILLGMSIMQPGMIGFVLTAKSIARFKKLDDSSFVEYFIIGTFVSFISAIIGGIIIYSLKIIPAIK
ncbi:DUF3307 domain-containing protein [Sporosalibacterium faouarense]|uniref:DUF3307 domain-containing protein n=1 Tax=Sporosalibacterium faouarense TaxID=516123 RepID=UPI00141CD864|nr:DUF3307 domain-containing protein [Sporosalibacterium faouarense]MTI46653.1 DUF3307 domain-containing protein [Bacillota bacterium]